MVKETLSLLSLGLETSQPYYKDGTAVVTISLDSYEIYFKSLYSSIVSSTRIRPNSDPVISESEFVWICKYFLKVRLDFVYARALGVLIPDRVTIPGAQVPTSLCKLLRNIGVVTVFDGKVRVVPKPEDPPTEANKTMSKILASNPKLITRFSSLVESTSNKRWSSASPSVVDSELGSVFWLLSAREIGDRNQLAKDHNSVVVTAAFSDWKKEDAILAAIVQNGFDGKVGSCGIKYCSGGIQDLHVLRNVFNLKATL